MPVPIRSRPESFKKQKFFEFIHDLLSALKHSAATRCKP